MSAIVNHKNLKVTEKEIKQWHYLVKVDYTFYDGDTFTTSFEMENVLHSDWVSVRDQNMKGVIRTIQDEIDRKIKERGW